MRFVGFLAKRQQRRGSKELQTGGRNIESLPCSLASCCRKGFKRIAGAARATVYIRIEVRKNLFPDLLFGLDLRR
jgi:hypothetical protein